MSETFQITINPKYLGLVPRPDKIQLSMLKHSIQEDGQQVKIIVNPDGIVLDGHTRFSICKELGLRLKFTIKKFTSKEKEKQFVLSANVNRRQLTLFQRGEILFDWWKDEKIRSNSQGGHSRWKLARTGISADTTTNGKKERLLPKFARIIGTNATLAHEITWLMLHAPEEYKVKLRKEEMTIRSAYVELAKPSIKSTAQYKAEGKNYLTFTTCLNCTGKMISITETKCHVHIHACCPKCGWGY